MIEEVVIDETNFEEYFFDVRKNKPKEGQVIACFRATAELVEGNEKRNLMDLLTLPNKVLSAVQVMRKLMHASEEDSVRVCRHIAADMMSMSYEEVLRKSYSYTMELFYYTDPKHLPNNDPHWTSISILNLDEFVGKSEDEESNGLKISSKIEWESDNNVKKLGLDETNSDSD